MNEPKCKNKNKQTSAKHKQQAKDTLLKYVIIKFIC